MRHPVEEVDWDEIDAAAEDAMPPSPPPQMVIDIISTDVLQLTISRTALDVFNTLSQVSQFLSNMCITCMW